MVVRIKHPTSIGSAAVNPTIWITTNSLLKLLKRGLRFKNLILSLALSSSGLFLAPFEGRVIATMQIAKPLRIPAPLQTR